MSESVQPDMTLHDGALAADERALLAAVKWNDDGLVPAVAQDARTGRVLMLAYMNRDSLEASLREGFAIYYSRSRGKLWKKGESSGHTQKLVGVHLDCDGDTLLLRVEQIGPACHTNASTCFFQHAEGDGLWHDSPPPKATVLHQLVETIKERRGQNPEASYVAKLFHKGLDKILKKVGEECAETLIAGKNEDRGELIYESADLLFHLLVLLEAKEIDLDEVLLELARRQGTSGIAEKAARQS